MSNASFGNLNGVNNATPLTPTIAGVSLVGLADSKLLFNFVAIPPMLMAKIEPRNVLNYTNYYPVSSPTDNIPTKTSLVVNSNSYQLGMIPSKIMIYAKKKNQDTYDSNSFAVIKKISLTFGNKSGLLSTALPVQLYQMSVNNGLQMNFYEWSGAGVTNTTAGNPTIVPTIGSILVLDPAIDLALDTEYSNLSRGQFQVQFQVELYTQGAVDCEYMLYMVCANSGLFITDSGVSSANLAMITQEQVLKTKAQEAILDKKTYEDKIMGGSIENLNCIGKHLKQCFHKASEKEHQLDSGASESLPATASGMDASGMKMGKRRIHKFEK